MKLHIRSPLEWLRQRKRLVMYLLSFVLVVGIQTLCYWLGMRAFEDEPRSLLESFGVVIQSLTTTGYGQDAPWESLPMSILVVIMQFTGVAYLFIAFPLFLVPWLREAMGEPRAPEAVGSLQAHVIFFNDSPLFSTLHEELTVNDVEYVVLEDDSDRAKQLYEDDAPVVHTDPLDEQALRDVNVTDATCVIIDARDLDGIGAILTIREVSGDVPVVCLIDDPAQSQYLRYAGASTVLSPKHRLGKALADKARNIITVDDESVAADIELVEIPVIPDSPLHGEQLSHLSDLEEIGATIIGGWIGGEFLTTFEADHVVDHNTVLVVAGTADEITAVERLAQSSGRLPAGGPMLLAGYGIVGRTAAGILQKAGYDLTIVDHEAKNGVDVVGDVTDADTLPNAGVADAATLLLALPNDDAAIRATLVASHRHDIEIVTVANNEDTVSKLYHAGADYVLGLPRLAGQLILHELSDEPKPELLDRLQLAPIPAGPFEGDTPQDVEQSLQATVVGVQRDSRFITDVPQEWELQAGDELIVAGPGGAFEDVATEESGAATE